MTISLGTAKEFLPFVFILLGTALAFIAPFMQTENKRSKKTKELLSSFRLSLHVQDIEKWREIFHGKREAVAVPSGHFINRQGKPEPLELMWADDSEEHSAIQRMAEGLETVCAEMQEHSVDIKKIWYEIGQLMETMRDWVAEIPGVLPESSFLDEQYPFLKQVFEKHGHHFKKWPCRSYIKN